MRVQVLWNVDKPLRFQRNFLFGNDQNTILHFKYERLRNFCQRCGLLSHDKKECRLRFENDEAPGSDDDGDEDMGDGPAPELGILGPQNNELLGPMDAAVGQIEQAPIVEAPVTEDVRQEEESQIREIRFAKGKFREDEFLAFLKTVQRKVLVSTNGRE